MVHSNKVRDNKDLDVWNRSMDLVVDVYDVVKSFPQSVFLYYIRVCVRVRNPTFNF
jgi:hypothetical protein